MSKPIVRVVVALLICFAVVAAVSPSVQARLESVFRKAEVINTASDAASTENQVLEKGTLEKKAPASSKFDDFSPSDSSGGCNSSDPTSDY
jgi:hypothetical protein